MYIGLISDTHGWIHPQLPEYFKDVDEIWHAGDIGNIETADALAAFKPLRAVHGNIDDSIVRLTYKEHLKFRAGDVKIWITHIGGVPGHYDRRVMPVIYSDPPGIFICGHSHSALVKYDDRGGFLYINPGAAGFNGFHEYMTAVRFHIDGSEIHGLELIELGKRGKTAI
jgi:uncharacterized protein